MPRVDGGPPVQSAQFVPVPPLEVDRRRHPRGERARTTAEGAATSTSVLPRQRGGAGLELDLTDPRHREEGEPDGAAPGRDAVPSKRETAAMAAAITGRSPVVSVAPGRKWRAMNPVSMSPARNAGCSSAQR